MFPDMKTDKYLRRRRTLRLTISSYVEQVEAVASSSCCDQTVWRLQLKLIVCPPWVLRHAHINDLPFHILTNNFRPERTDHLFRRTDLFDSGIIIYICTYIKEKEKNHGQSEPSSGDMSDKYQKKVVLLTVCKSTNWGNNHKYFSFLRAAKSQVNLRAAKISNWYRNLLHPWRNGN